MAEEFGGAATKKSTKYKKTGRASYPTKMSPSLV